MKKKTVDQNKIQFEKEDLSLPLGTNMRDRCVCMSKCTTPCGRKYTTERYCTASNLGEVCSKYVEEK